MLFCLLPFNFCRLSLIFLPFCLKVATIPLRVVRFTSCAPEPSKLLGFCCYLIFILRWSYVVLFFFFLWSKLNTFF